MVEPQCESICAGGAYPRSLLQLESAHIKLRNIKTIIWSSTNHVIFYMFIFKVESTPIELKFNCIIGGFDIYFEYLRSSNMWAPQRSSTHLQREEPVGHTIDGVNWKLHVVFMSSIYWVELSFFFFRRQNPQSHLSQNMIYILFLSTSTYIKRNFLDEQYCNWNYIVYGNYIIFANLLNYFWMYYKQCNWNSVHSNFIIIIDFLGDILLFLFLFFNSWRTCPMTWFR